jgi:hypothetical protein
MIPRVPGVARQDDQQDTRNDPQEVVMGCDGHASVYGVHAHESEGLPGPTRCAEPASRKSQRRRLDKEEKQSRVVACVYLPQGASTRQGAALIERPGLSGWPGPLDLLPDRRSGCQRSLVPFSASGHKCAHGSVCSGIQENSRRLSRLGRYARSKGCEGKNGRMKRTTVRIAGAPYLLAQGQDLGEIRQAVVAAGSVLVPASWGMRQRVCGGESEVLPVTSDRSG